MKFSDYFIEFNLRYVLINELFLTVYFFMRTSIYCIVYSSTCHEGTLPVRSQSVPSWQVVPRGRDRHFDTHIYGHRYIAHIVYALLMHSQNRSEGSENREIASTYYITA